MILTRQRLIAGAAFGSALLLGGAFVFQALGYAPCKMCIWQRYPHAVAIALGAVAVFVPFSALVVLAALAVLTTAAIGGYHMGVEQGWWAGPSSCSAGAIDTLDPDALFDQIMAAPLIRCDEIAWAFAGLSMAGWNMVISLILAAIWIAALRVKPTSA